MNDIVHDLIITARNLERELADSATIAAAAQRARKLTLDLEKLGKAFRAASVEFHKKK